MKLPGGLRRDSQLAALNAPAIDQGHIGGG
jgi:hypothetical protein